MTVTDQADTTRRELDEQAAAVVARLRRTFEERVTRPLAWRRAQLEGLDRLLVEGEEELLEALRQDLGKPRIEGWSTDVAYTRAEVRLLHRNLERWTAPERVRLPLLSLPGSGRIVREPLGVALIIGPWNYPVQLVLAPLAGALAAGCTAVVKPSEVAPATSAALARLVPRYLDERAVAVVEGGVPETTALLRQRWDTIFYTGNSNVGRVVARAAAEHLTPVTLELGGKSPNIVLPGVDVQKIAVEMHLRWSRNGGQGCAALARLLVHDSVYDEFLEAGASAFDQMVVGDPWDRATNIGPMIRPDHQNRVQGFIDGAAAEGGRKLLEVTKPLPEKGWFVNPVLLGNLPPNARAVQEEIFGPVAVILPFKDTEEAIRLANDTPFGLAANVWCDDPVEARRVAEKIRAGTVWINGGGAMRPDAPFGGYGRSGVGRELGEWGMREYLEVKHIQWRI